MKIYVIRWTDFHLDNSEVQSGTFEVAYTDEEEAQNALLANYNEVLAEQREEDPDLDTHIYRNDDGFAEYAVINKFGGNDTYEWYVDVVDVEV